MRVWLWSVAYENHKFRICTVTKGVRYNLVFTYGTGSIRKTREFKPEANTSGHEPIIDLETWGTVCLVSLINSRPGLNLFAISFTLEKGAFLGRLKTSDLQQWRLKPKSIEWFIEDQDFLPSCDLVPLPPTPSHSRQQIVSFFSLPLCHRSRLLTREGVGKEPNHTTARKPGRQ